MESQKEKFEILIRKIKELGYEVEIISEEKQIAKLSKNNKNRFIVGPLMPLNTTVSARLSKDKNITKKILKSIGIVTPEGEVFKNWVDLEKAVDNRSLEFPLVVKPNDAALGSRVSVDINNKEDLKKAAEWVWEDKEEALVEEFLPYEDHRFFVVDYKLVAVAKRVQPSVVGDGEKTLQQLIDALNLTKKEKKVQIDYEAVRYLKKQGVDLETVIENGKKIIIRGNANIQTGGTIVDVTDDIAPKFKDLAEKAAKELGMRISGVDIMAEDISNPDSKYVITELNGLPSYPYIHDHPDIGKPREVLIDVLEAVFND